MLTRAADRLETALSGGVVDPGAADDLDLAHELQHLDRLLAPLGPPPAFVNALYERLLDEPPVPAPEVRPARTGAVGQPRVVTMGGRRGPGLRIAVAGVVGLLALIGVLGVAGRSSLPGQPLYAARQLVDRAGVALGGSEQGRGLRLLDVAEHHVDDALALASLPGRSASDLRTALTDGLDATQEARRDLLSDFAARTDPQSLTPIGAFAGRVLPRTDGLSRAAPEVADAVTNLRAGVAALRDEALRLLATCTSCGSATDDARRQLATLTPSQGATTAPGPAGPTGPTGPTTLPGATPGGDPSLSASPSPGAPGSVLPPASSVPSSPSSVPSSAPGSTTGGRSGGSPSAGPTTPVTSPPGPNPSPSVSTPALPAPTSLLPTLPTVSPSLTLSVSASITLPGATATLNLP